MKKMNKATSIVIFTVLALGSIFIADYSKSGAKYYKDVETGLTYNMGLSQLSKKELGTFIPRKDKSETDMLYVEYSVPRNLIMTDEDTTDTYTIVVDKGCEIKTVNGTKATSASNSYTFTYNDSNASDIIVAYTCPVNKIEISSTSDFMQSKISIYEQMDTDVRRFLYTKNDGLFKKSDVLPKPIVSDYHQLIILETDDAATINTKINEWIENNKREYDKNYSSYVWINNGLSTETMKTYLKKAYTSDIKNFDPTAIRGVDFTHEGDTYTYEMNEEFLSYALTDAVYDNTKKERYFYFADTTVDDSILEETFKYYVDKYMYAEGSTEYTEIMDYITNKGGIISVIKNNNKIPGMTYSAGRILLEKDFMDYVHPIKQPISLNYSDYAQERDLRVELIKQININYSDILTNANYSGFINADRDLWNPAKRNGQTFNDYLIYNFDGDMVVINVYSAGDGIVNAIASKFDSTISIDLSTATTVSIATTKTNTADILTRYNEVTSILDANNGSNYSNVVTSDMIDNYETKKGLYIYSQYGIIKAYYVNAVDETGFGVLTIPASTIASDDINSSPDMAITDDPEDVTAGDTPDDEIPIFDDLVTTEPSDDVVDPVAGENETETENPENQEDEEQEETEESDDNGKEADTDIEKEFVSDIEEVEKLIEDMKDFVGDAEEISEEEEAIAEVDELIETVKDYMNEA